MNKIIKVDEKAWELVLDMLGIDDFDEDIIAVRKEKVYKKNISDIMELVDHLKGLEVDKN